MSTKVIPPPLDKEMDVGLTDKPDELEELDAEEDVDLLELFPLCVILTLTVSPPALTLNQSLLVVELGFSVYDNENQVAFFVFTLAQLGRSETS